MMMFGRFQFVDRYREHKKKQQINRTITRNTFYPLKRPRTFDIPLLIIRYLSNCE